MSKFNIGDKVKVVHEGQGTGADDLNKVVTITEIGEYPIGSNVGYKVSPPIGNSKSLAFGGFIGEKTFELVEDAVFEVGDKIRILSGYSGWWSIGKEYSVVKRGERLGIFANDGDFYWESRLKASGSITWELIKATSWHDRGELPPVGTRCLIKTEAREGQDNFFDSWTEVEIKYINKEGCVVGVVKGLYDCFIDQTDYDINFRPLQSEKEQWLVDASDITGSVLGEDSGALSDLYDAMKDGHLDKP